MTVNFLKVQADEAVAVLDSCIVAGYELKRSIDSEYYESRENGQFQTNATTRLNGWRKRIRTWVVNTQQKLNTIYISPRYAFDFEETVGTSHVIVGQNIEWCSLSDRIRTRIDRLIQFDDFIKQEFYIEYVAGDKVEGNKYQQDGDGNTQQVHK
ncbi:hypothetical protein A3B57_03890 [Microgenomates group bacterium RIFCSPLOWO2_01_FULL_47_10]|nr:MAG: hypothetical protein A3B57_03890 [Microgenomates group bacterium RIFCSPLOWO2_01_FULL_47_10]